MSRPRISIVITVFNGKRFLGQELDSMLPQLNQDDEILLLDDGSTDGSVALIQQYAENWPQIQLIQAGHVGLIKNFARGIEQATGEIIFLADQDDIWVSNKVQHVCEQFQNTRRPLLVMHDAMFVNGIGEPLGESLFHWRNVQTGFYKNWMRNSYMGCCMAFSRSLVPYILPFPKKLPMHDQWIGLIAQHYGDVKLLPDRLLHYRRHDRTVTDDQHKGICQMIRWRARLLFYYTLRLI